MEEGRELLYKGRVFSLMREAVTLPGGRVTRMDIIRHPGAAAMVPVTDAGDVLLLRQYRHAVGGYIWEIPAGTMDPGETPEECAARELVEETGFAAERLERLSSITPVPGYSSEVIHLFLATGLVPRTGDLDHDEVLTVHATPISKVYEMAATGEITDAKTLAGLLLARTALFTSG
ncbi:MAG: NUDIX hydrolase [Thermodesulfobacteriota bacterium]